MPVASNLSLRIIAILVAGFVALQLMLVLLMMLPTTGDPNRPYNLPLPDHVRAMAEAIEQTPSARRPTLVEAFNGSLFSVRLVPAHIDGTAPEPPPLASLHASYEAVLDGRPIRLARERPVLGEIIGDRPWPRFVAPVTLTIGLRSGGLLVIDGRPSALLSTFLRRRALTGAMGGILVLIILMLAVRQTTRPIVSLSRGVRLFGRALDAPDVPVTGSREMRELATAFNEMKTRIGTLMTERTRLLAAIAHDMRTYLTRLRLRAEFIDDADQRRRAAADLDEMSQLLDDTIFFAREHEGPAPARERLDLGAELRAIARLRGEMGEAVSLDPRYSGDGIDMSCAPLAFRRMIDNLIDNGLRYGMNVTLCAEARAGEIRLSVLDDGPGVPPEALSRLGEPFERIEPSRDRQKGGAGLGLAIVRGLAERNGMQLLLANRQPTGFSASLIQQQQG
ncbi:two-component sensor histidine kinase [Sphingomonas oleivorans]|uniref:histidine kinase n=1 Tax=Sphingomonas oleivorans TaxID=1735121 RepID=A0A2T5FVE4_9SPHN|nr:ATP-binding protein [Sphingomonas oleivorans]PTQ09420.1 two-component sensor histidine kinase [Sphingomonas oleivorans]